MKAKILLVGLSLCLVWTGCTSWEIKDGYVRIGPFDHIGDYIGKTIVNLGVMLFTLLLALGDGWTRYPPR